MFGHTAGLASTGETDLDATDTALTGVFGRLTQDLLDQNTEGRAAPLVAGMDQTGDFPAALNGDFALALWDGQARALTLASDHFATRPLYYIRLTDGVAFASDIEWLQSFSAHGEGDFYIPCLQGFLGGRFWAFEDRTMIPDIHKVPPGTRIRLDQNGTTPQRYWSPEDAPHVRLKSDQAYYDQARALLHQAVLDRVPRTAQYDAHLSGGLDSTVITGILARDSHDRGTRAPQGICWHPLAQADQTATPEQEIFQLCLETFRIQGDSVYDLAQEMTHGFWSIDPVTTPTTTSGAELAVIDAAESRKTSLIFSGFGGDEALSFSGLRWHHAHAPAGIVDAYRSLGNQAGRGPAIGLLRSELAATDEPPTIPFWRLLTPRAQQIFNLQFGHLSNRMAGWSQLGAPHGVQYSYPLLDKRLIEFVLGVPWRLFDRNQGNRSMMRRVVQGLVPEIVAKRFDKTEQSISGQIEKIAHDAVLPFKDLMLLIKENGPRSRYIRTKDLNDQIARILTGQWRGVSHANSAISFLMSCRSIG